ncbi:MAG: stage IV sporulation protein A [Oscillospiraceae bacterium]|nr:stage IV sporulation protein A [Oscillospiraceae bacterium]
MKDRNLYNDISERTNGDIYIGVVGPVRTGKSTFIKKFMDLIVLPNMGEEYQRERAIDEMPQSAAGRTIMTTEPKFIPEQSVSISVDKSASFNVRMIDCVGYIVPSALGYVEGDSPRMVMTPWYEEPIPFNMAAEIGTKKVITEHSTIGLVVTTDGSIGDIPREEYEEAEERVIGELQEIHKPFIILLNTADPSSEQTKALAAQLQQRHGVPVMPVNCLDLTEGEIREILSKILFEFPIKEIKVEMPAWLTQLDKTHWLRSEVLQAIKDAAAKIERIRQLNDVHQSLKSCEHLQSSFTSQIDLGKGMARIAVVIKPQIFFKVLAEQTGISIEDESDLLHCMLDFVAMKKQYDKLKEAYEQVQETGYGIVMPDMDEMTLEEPEIVKQSGKYGIRLKANATAIHMMKTKISTAVTPMVGSEQQSEELISYLMTGFEEDPGKIWESNIFGKSLHELVNEGLHTKLNKMPPDARNKLRETIERIINDGCNGLICIIL